MSVSSISNSPVVPVQTVQPIKLSQAQLSGLSASTGSSGSSAAQESAETPAVTQKEAAKGDKQAIKLLAKEAAAAQPQGGNQSGYQSASTGLNLKA